MFVASTWNAVGFCILLLYPLGYSSNLLISDSFSVDSLGFPTYQYMIKLSGNIFGLYVFFLPF